MSKTQSNIYIKLLLCKQNICTKFSLLKQVSIKTIPNMIDDKIKEIRDFCVKNTNQSNIEKYSRYFKDGFDSYGIDNNIYQAQKELWIEKWHNEMTIENYLDLGDKLVKTGKFEEISFAISFMQSKREDYTESTFDRVGCWFDFGIRNWGNTDVLCMLVLSSFLIDKIVDFEKLKEWTAADSQWKRRAVAVTLVELVKTGLKPSDAIAVIEPLMMDKSEYVQKGIGTLLRGLWKNYPTEIEHFLLKWKDKCGRLIIQYSTEKMDKEYRKKFRKAK